MSPGSKIAAVAAGVLTAYAMYAPASASSPAQTPVPSSVASGPTGLPMSAAAATKLKSLCEQGPMRLAQRRCYCEAVPPPGGKPNPCCR